MSADWDTTTMSESSESADDSTVYRVIFYNYRRGSTKTDE